jgi:hypothetical protein
MLLVLLLSMEKDDGKVESDEIPMPVLPDKSALVLSDDKMAPVCGSNIVKHPPPPGVSTGDGLVVVTPTMYFISHVVVDSNPNATVWERQSQKRCKRVVLL